MTRHAQPVRQAGVTLLELVIALAIIGVLAVMATPSIIDRWQRATVVVLADRLASAISLAQKTAQYRHVETELTPQNPAIGWASGWQLTELPPKTAGTAPTSRQEILMSVSLPTVPVVKITTGSSVSRGLTYEAVGYSRTAGVSGGTFTLSSGRHTRCVVINDAGRILIRDPATDDSCKAASNADP